MERAALLGIDSLVADLASHQKPAPGGGCVLPFPATLPATSRAAARAMVERQDGNKSAAAAALGIGRKRLYALLREADAPVAR